MNGTEKYMNAYKNGILLATREVKIVSQLESSNLSPQMVKFLTVLLRVLKF